jgi:hypothetical protein
MMKFPFHSSDTVCTADSHGVVRGLIHVWRNAEAKPQWVPLADLASTLAESHWIIGITESQVNLRPR